MGKARRMPVAVFSDKLERIIIVFPRRRRAALKIIVTKIRQLANQRLWIRPGYYLKCVSCMLQ